MRVSLTLTRISVVVAATAALMGTSLGPVHAQQSGQVRYELASSENEARSRVREQLADVDFPTDAVGATSALTGAIVLDRTGKVLPASSKIKLQYDFRLAPKK